MGVSTTEQMENIARTLFRRCVLCPDGFPSCPDCDDGYECSRIPKSCHTCPQTECVAMGSVSSGTTSSTSDSDSGPNAGAIAGGVIGGLLFVGILIWLFWKYGLKARRQRESQYWSEYYEQQEKQHTDDFTMRRDARASTHTVASMASTVLTRASNIIQIAYIPGVTNRSGPASPQPLVPPVPPIPAASPGSSQARESGADLHFLPGDIRDSTYTDGRNSYAPTMDRNSVASTVYRNNAIVSPQPATTVVRGKAAMVSVGSNSSESTPAVTPGVDAPAMPQIPAHLQTQSAKLKSQGGSVRSVAQMGKPTAINVTRKKSSDLLTSPNSDSASPSDASASGYTNPAIHAALAAASSTRLDSSSQGSPSIQSPRGEQLSPASYRPGDSDIEDEKSPFSDSAQKQKIVDAVRRASKTEQRSRSPFDDENAVSDR